MFGTRFQRVWFWIAPDFNPGGLRQITFCGLMIILNFIAWRTHARAVLKDRNEVPDET